MNQNYKKTHKIYYSDERHDDFGQVGLSRPSLPANYKYYSRNIFFRGLAWFIYFGFALPIIHFGMLVHGIKVENRNNLKEIRGKGAFVYANHVSLNDVTKYQTRVFRFRRVNILGYSDASSIPFVRHLIKCLGYVPLPLKGDLDNMIKMNDAFRYFIQEKKQLVLIFPEAHIWPCYTKIRDFRSGSFNYPATLNAPILPIVTTWHKSKFSKKPKQTLLIGRAIYPRADLSVLENKEYLHDACLNQMKELAASVKQYEYIEYIKKEEGSN